MGHPKVTLAGKEYEVAPLPIRHIRKILPLANAVAKRNIQGADQESIDAIYEIGRLLMDVVKPGMTDEQFEDLPLRPSEIGLAMPVFIQQAGLERKSEAAAPVGEAPAES